MDAHRKRSKWALPLVAIVAFVLGGGSVAACIVFLRHASRPDPRRARIRADVVTIGLALDTYAMAHAGRYPESLAVLVTPDEHGDRYLNQDRVPRDPWDREYVWACESRNVMTLGRDGKQGGTGEDADIDAVSIADGR